MRLKTAILALFIAILAPSVASAQQTFVTPNGTVIDWYGNIISQPISVVLFNSQPHLIVKTPLEKHEDAVCKGRPGVLFTACMKMVANQDF